MTRGRAEEAVSCWRLHWAWWNCCLQARLASWADPNWAETSWPQPVEGSICSRRGVWSAWHRQKWRKFTIFLKFNELGDRFFGLRIGMQPVMWELQFYKLHFILLYLHLSPCPRLHTSPGSVRGQIVEWSQFWHYFSAWNCKNIFELWKQTMKSTGKFREGICSPEQQGETEVLTWQNYLSFSQLLSKW